MKWDSLSIYIQTQNNSFVHTLNYLSYFVYDRSLCPSWKVLLDQRPWQPILLS
jgi:hypothetical protein